MKRALLIVAALGCLGAAPPPSEPSGGQRPCEPAKPGERFEVDFRDVPLRTVARLVSCAAEVNVMFAPSELASRQVTVVAARPVPLKQLVALFEASLVGAGLELERRGGYWTIRPGG